VVLWPRCIDELEQFFVWSAAVVNDCCAPTKHDGGAQIGAHSQGAGGNGVSGDDRVIVPFQ
jgi:hypothetical protein